MRCRVGVGRAVHQRLGDLRERAAFGDLSSKQGVVGGGAQAKGEMRLVIECQDAQEAGPRRLFDVCAALSDY